jgi:signal transduction histidine kinase
LREAIAAAPDGVLLGRSREGVPVETIYRSLPGSGGWVVAFGIPLATLERPVQRSLVLLASEGGAGLLLAALLTSLVARDLAQRRADEADRARRSLNASEESRLLALEAADLGAWRWTMESDAFDGSPRSLALLAAAAPGPAERPLRWADAIAAIPPDERSALTDAVESCLRDGANLDGEYRVGEAAAPLRWVRITGRTLAADPGPPSTVHGVVADISGRKQAEAERLALLRGMALAQEDERRRIARDLHDQVGQTVTGLALGLKTLEAALATVALDATVQDRLSWLRALAADIGHDIHRAAVDLGPAVLDDLGLPSALSALAASLAERHAIAVDVQFVGVVERLPPEIETAVYRVVQEALTNVIRHARAGAASVLVERRTNEIRLIIEDNGVGFDPDSRTDEGRPGLGLSGMRERLRLVDGTLELETASGTGTTLFVQVPIGQPSAS